MANNLKIDIPADTSLRKSSTRINKLKFGKRNVLISDLELKKLNQLYEKYTDTYGVELGFVNYLINKNR